MGHPKVLITGARGRIGKILISHLADSFDLCGLDRCTSDDDPYVVADVSENIAFPVLLSTHAKNGLDFTSE